MFPAVMLLQVDNLLVNAANWRQRLIFPAGEQQDG
jgi:hypothetical protein